MTHEMDFGRQVRESGAYFWKACATCRNVTATSTRAWAGALAPRTASRRPRWTGTSAWRRPGLRGASAAWCWTWRLQNVITFAPSLMISRSKSTRPALLDQLISRQAGLMPGQSLRNALEPAALLECFLAHPRRPSRSSRPAAAGLRRAVRSATTADATSRRVSAACRPRLVVGSLRAAFIGTSGQRGALLPRRRSRCAGADAAPGAGTP